MVGSGASIYGLCIDLVLQRLDNGYLRRVSLIGLYCFVVQNLPNVAFRDQVLSVPPANSFPLYRISSP
jgi:hypothetical protein